VAKNPKSINVTSVPFSAVVQQRELDWPVPMRELLQDLNAGEFVWRRLQYVFRLPDPNEFTPGSITLPAAEAQLLQRFSQQARAVAATSFLAGTDAVTVHISDNGMQETVERDLSAPDITTGFMVMLRQCYGHDEEASFSKAQNILARRLHESGEDSAVDVVKQWRKSHAALKNQTLEQLVQERLVHDGLMPAESLGPDGQPHSLIVRAQASPDELLLTSWYGGGIHWGQRRTALETLAADPFNEAMFDFEARQAASDLAFFYMGFAVLVERTFARATPPATGDAALDSNIQ
jgi:hypothetical protein